jgi:glycosyltransferase involved in cell wall biosynthesis
MFVSVLVCTRNRCGKLRGLLQSLARLDVPSGSSFEVVVVDNGSTDSTADTCDQFGALLPLRYHREWRRGKSIALDRGIEAARGEVVAFTDDDCVVDASWLRVLVSEFSQDPDLAAAGGRVELYNAQDKNVTLTTYRETVVVNTTPALLFAPLIIGANMAFRATALTKVGRFDTRLGPGSRCGAVAEDIDYMYRTFRKKLKIVYFPALVVFHNHGRTTDAEIEELRYRYRVGRAALFTKHAFDEMVLNVPASGLKHLYWDSLLPAKTVARRLFTQESSRTERRELQAMLVGALSRLLRA